jgi:putative ABC transport system permease protein
MNAPGDSRARASSWLRTIFRRTRLEREMSDELHFHIDAYADDLVRSGVPRDEAVRRARADFGGIERAKEECRDEVGVSLIESLAQDVRFALRSFAKNPGFTTVAMLTLALGIGANTAIFSVVESVLLRPLQFQRPERLFVVTARAGEARSAPILSSGPDLSDYVTQSRSLKVAGVLPRFHFTWNGVGDPKTVVCTAVGDGFFELLGVKPLLGRLYTHAEYHVDGGNIVLSYHFWKEQLDGDPLVIGKTLRLSGTTVTVIGVLPPIADLFADTDVFPTLVPDFNWMNVRKNKFLTVFARVNDGVTSTQATEELTGILRRAPDQQPNLTAQLTPLRDDIVGSVRTELEIVMASVVLVLLITCFNVAYLLLARGARREPEMAVRLSLGAGRGRLIQQLFAEHLTLALVGGGIGTGLAVVLVRALRGAYLDSLPRGQVIAVDGYVLAFAIATTLLTTLLLAWWVSSASSKVDVTTALRTGRARIAGFRRVHFRVLLVSEIAIAIVLMVGAGLLLRSFREVARVNPGFRADHLLTGYFRTNYFVPEGGVFYNRVMARLSELPGMRASAVAGCLPGSVMATATLTFDDRVNDPDHQPVVEACWISPRFFEAVDAPIIAGRPFDARDDARAQAVTIVNRALADQLWPGRDPIGRTIAPNYVGSGNLTTGAPRPRMVVGVAANIRHDALDKPAQPALYTPFLQDETNRVFAGMFLLVRSDVAAASLAPAIRNVVRDINPDQPVDALRTMDDVLSRTLAPRRLSSYLLAAFAALALLLSAVGIYGMVATSVGARTSEIGVRMALGAQRGEVLRLVLTEGLKLTMAGVAIGVLAALGLAQFMRGMLYGVSDTDPLTFIGVSLLLAAVALIASYVPARRATRVDPVVALRHE